ncbi:MAG: ShlB/FhaC/HecB family hemolysin secretion/activation protein [Chroococcales cyanobacterium]
MDASPDQKPDTPTQSRWLNHFNFCLLLSLIGVFGQLPSYADSLIPEESSIGQIEEDNPNSDRFLQPNELPSEELPEASPSLPQSSVPSPAISETESETIPIQEIEITGNTAFSDTELKELINDIIGQTVPRQELLQAVDAITQRYLEEGYITSRATLVEESLSSGAIEIRVIEGTLAEIQIQGTERIRESYVRSRLQRGAGTPLQPAEIEEQLRLLQSDPLFSNIEASLRAGEGIGESILAVRVTEADPFDGRVFVDNYSPPSVGSERLGTALSYRNLTGFGDEISLQYTRTTAGGSQNVDAAYEFPINALDGTIEARVAYNDNEIIQEPFAELDIRGDSILYELNYRQPFIRSPREEFALSFGFTYQDGQTFTFAGPTPIGIGPDEEGISRTSVLKFGQEYTRRDTLGAWAARSLFSFGTGLFDATINDDPIPDSRFVSWFGQLQRVQILNPNNFLILQGDIQLSSDGLLPSQQFVIGGGQSVRGFRQNVRAGDNGFRVSVEDRITLERNEAGISTFQLAPFVEAGKVWNVDDNPNELPSQTFIAGIGVGMLWQPLPDLHLRLDYGYPLVDLDDRGQNAQEEGFYFSVSYDF